VFVGSLAYSAPEQILGAEVGPPADWWALAAVAYEILGGVRPFLGEKRRTLVAQVLAASPPPLVGMPPALDEAIRSIFALDPAKRPGAEVVRDACRRFRSY
jgi:serine/threonine-protein kinase